MYAMLSLNPEGPPVLIGTYSFAFTCSIVNLVIYILIFLLLICKLVIFSRISIHARLLVIALINQLLS
jgi:hypothetical protein